MTSTSDHRYSLAVSLSGRRVLVVGGGDVATRRVKNLLESGARVDVVTPWASPELWTLADDGRIAMTLREFEDGDQSGAWLVHTCTGIQQVDEHIVAVCDASRVWCVNASDARRSPAWAAATAHAGDVTVAVTSGDPRRSMTIRDAITDLLASGDLPLHRGRIDRTAIGWVALVGGGPGDPELITVRGRRLLAEADVVVVDRLAPHGLRDALPAHVEVIDAGKGPDAHVLTQDQINALIVEKALEGHRVVRLKGGDPFVLGRGGEEVLACATAGVPVEVVPGITSVVAVAGSAGIPITHRGVSTGFTVLSAHDHIEDALADAPSSGTLVLLMGVGRLPLIASTLVELGRDRQTPVAIVERGTRPDQRTTIGTLATIVDRASEAFVESPAIIVVGDVVGLADRIGAAMGRVHL